MSRAGDKRLQHDGRGADLRDALVSSFSLGIVAAIIAGAAVRYPGRAKFYLYGVPTTACDPFPSLQAVRKTVGGHPAVVAWYDERVAQKKSLESLSPAEQVLAGCRSM